MKLKTLILTTIATATISTSLHAKPQFRVKHAAAAHKPASAEHSDPTTYRAVPIMHVNPTPGVMPSPSPMPAATPVVTATPAAEIAPATKPARFTVFMGCHNFFRRRYHRWMSSLMNDDKYIA
jgi:hypothetical protein